MPILIPIPEGFQLPQEKQFDVPVTVTVADGKNLLVLAIAGKPVADAEEPPAEEAAPAPETFEQAVERGMKNQ